MNLWIVPKRIGDDHKKEIRNGDDQAEKKTDGGFPPMRGDAERYDNEGKGHARKRKGKTVGQVRLAGTDGARVDDMWEVSVCNMAKCRVRCTEIRCVGV